MEKKENPLSERKAAGAARLFRIITAPPFMTGSLLIVLCLMRKDLFFEVYSMIAAWIGLVLLPLTAYPLQKFIPGFKDKGREGQRNLAFVFTLIGYTGCFIYGLIKATGSFRLLFCVYFLTIVILCVFNRLFHIRASGHSASSVSPLIFSIIYANAAAAAGFALAFSLSIWSSLYSKRHKLSELLYGIISFAIAFLLSYLIAL